MARSLRSGGTWEEAYSLADTAEIWRKAGDTAETLRLWRVAVAATQVGVTDTFKLLARIAGSLRSMGREEEANEVARLLPANYPWASCPNSGPQNNEMQLTRSAMANESRGPRS